jgi:hypothetical protein
MSPKLLFASNSFIFILKLLKASIQNNIFFLKLLIFADRAWKGHKTIYHLFILKRKYSSNWKSEIYNINWNYTFYKYLIQMNTTNTGIIWSQREERWRFSVKKSGPAKFESTISQIIAIWTENYIMALRILYSISTTVKQNCIS